MSTLCPEPAVRRCRQPAARVAGALGRPDLAREQVRRARVPVQGVRQEQERVHPERAVVRQARVRGPVLPAMVVRPEQVPAHRAVAAEELTRPAS